MIADPFETLIEASPIISLLRPRLLPGLTAVSSVRFQRKPVVVHLKSAPILMMDKRFPTGSFIVLISPAEMLNNLLSAMCAVTGRCRYSEFAMSKLLIIR